MKSIHDSFLATRLACLVLLAAGVTVSSAKAQSADPGAMFAPAAPLAGVPTVQTPYQAQLAAEKLKQDTASGLRSAKNEPYTGPTEIVQLEPTPLLDGEGKPRLDSFGRPMFNAPVKQQRDKKGHPLFNAQGEPVFQTASELGYDEHGHKLRAEKVKAPRMPPPSTMSHSVAE